MWDGGRRGYWCLWSSTTTLAKWSTRSYLLSSSVRYYVYTSTSSVLTKDLEKQHTASLQSLLHGASASLPWQFFNAGQLQQRITDRYYTKSASTSESTMQRPAPWMSLLKWEFLLCRNLHFGASEFQRAKNSQLAPSSRSESCKSNNLLSSPQGNDGQRTNSTTAISIARTVAVFSLSKSDDTWDFAPVTLYSSLEIDTGLICACLPVIAPLLRFMPGKSLASCH